MNPTLAKILPSLLIGIDVLASIAYFTEHDWRRGLYWLFAAGLTACVTY